MNKVIGSILKPFSIPYIVEIKFCKKSGKLIYKTNSICDFHIKQEQVEALGGCSSACTKMLSFCRSDDHLIDYDDNEILEDCFIPKSRF